jgi:hypothetical protein
MVVPVQVSADRWVVAAYVMTRDVARDYAPGRFRLRLEGLPGDLEATATDPLDGEDVEVDLRQDERGATIELLLTDAPRLVTLTR